MDNYIKEQAEVGEQILNMISPEKREELSVLAVRIIALQRSVAGKIKILGIDKDCAECKDDCCKDSYKREIFSKEYFVFLLLVIDDEVKAKIWHTIGLINLTVDECIFKHQFEGCEIPGGVRPSTCRSFFCGKTKAMRDLERDYRYKFVELEKDFRRALYS